MLCLKLRSQISERKHPNWNLRRTTRAQAAVLLSNKASSLSLGQYPMKSLRLAHIVAVLLLSMVVLLAGCGGVSSSSSMTPPPPPPSGGGGGGGGGGGSPHGTFVYVRNNPFPTGSTSGFRMNSDGTLTALQGSPFSISGPLAVGGSFLLASNKGTITSFRIDAGSGALTQAGTAMASNSGPIAADAANTYVSGTAADGSTAIF